MADILGSSEYNSAVGKAQSNLSGLDQMGVALRQMVVAPEGVEVQFQQRGIKLLGNAKQHGREHTYAHTHVRTRMHAVSGGVVAFHNHSILRCVML